MCSMCHLTWVGHPRSKISILWLMTRRFLTCFLNKVNLPESRNYKFMLSSKYWTIVTEMNFKFALILFYLNGFLIQATCRPFGFDWSLVGTISFGIKLLSLPGIDVAARFFAVRIASDSRSSHSWFTPLWRHPPGWRYGPFCEEIYNVQWNFARRKSNVLVVSFKVLLSSDRWNRTGD